MGSRLYAVEVDDSSVTYANSVAGARGGARRHLSTPLIPHVSSEAVNRRVATEYLRRNVT